MNPLQVGAIVGVLTAAGLYSGAQSVRRAPRSLAAARRQLHGRGQLPTGSSRTTAPSTRRAQLVDSLAGGAPGRWVTHRFSDGLDVVSLTPVDVISRVLAVTGVALFTALGAASALMVLGAVPASILSPVAALVIATLAGCAVVYDVTSKVDAGRSELRRVTNDFVQLVAVGLTTDQSVEEAVRFALEVGRSDGFDLLRSALHAAPQRGIAIWDALDEFGRRHDLGELTELASSVERQGTQGVSIRETVDSLAASMRARSLDQLEREADEANANLSGPTIGFVVATIVFLAYPMVHRINEAFGG